VTPKPSAGGSDGLTQRLAPLIRREISSIAALDAAIARESAPDYVVLLHDTKMSKQANLGQIATVIRRAGGVPVGKGGALKPLLKIQAAVLQRFSRTATFRAMRLAEVELISQYTAALEAAGDVLERRALRKALARALVHAHVLAAHIAAESRSEADARVLPRPLGEYFAGAAPRACMRCNLDRPGSTSALERRDSHPFTYICAACHAEVLAEFPEDLARQMDAWPRHIRDARVFQRAIGRPSKLNAIHRVLFPMSGLAEERPAPAAERAVDLPAMTPVPGPASGEVTGEVHVPSVDGAEGEYRNELFSYWLPRKYW